MKEIILNIASKERRCAFLKNGQLHDLVIERKKNRQLTGNIYRGRVANVLPNIQSAFVDIDEGDNGFIHISDILENTQKFQEMYDLDFEEKSPPKNRKKVKEADISHLLNADQPVLVQVVKEAMGTKGARLTSNVSIAGRYLVLLPNTPHRGVSKKIEDRNARERLKKIIRSFEMPQEMGLICRTASMEASAEVLIDEVNDLYNTWQGIRDGFQKATGPTCLFQESDLVRKAIMTAVDKKYERILVDDYPTFKACKKIYAKYADEHPLQIEFYRDKTPIFERFNIEKEIDRALRKKIWLQSGGYLFFDRTEAMYTVDVNSGRSTQQSEDRDVEETLIQINMEAADEIARQLRLRNVGGIIICDFIDMRSRKGQKRVLERLKESMKDDSAKCTILGMSEFGIVEITRQRLKESLGQTIMVACPYCAGHGLIKSLESSAIEIERALKKIIATANYRDLELSIHPELDRFLTIDEKKYFRDLVGKEQMSLVYSPKDTLHLNEYQFYSAEGKKIDA